MHEFYFFPTLLHIPLGLGASVSPMGEYMGGAWLPSGASMTQLSISKLCRSLQNLRDPMTTLGEDCVSTAGKSVQNWDIVIVFWFAG